MERDKLVVRTQDGLWAVVVRPLPGLVGLSILVAELGLVQMFELYSYPREMAMIVVALVGGVALARTTPGAALGSAVVFALLCWWWPFPSNRGEHVGVTLFTVQPNIVAAAAIAALAGQLCMLAVYRATASDRGRELEFRLRVGRGETSNAVLTRLVTGVAAGAAGGTVAVALVGHSWDGRLALPGLVTAALAAALGLVWWLLAHVSTRPFAERGFTSYLVPGLIVVAGVAVPPFAVARLWSTWDGEAIVDEALRSYQDLPPEQLNWLRSFAEALVGPSHTWFDPGVGGIGVLVGAALLLLSGMMLWGMRLTAGWRRRRERAVAAASASSEAAEPEAAEQARNPDGPGSDPLATST